MWFQGVEAGRNVPCALDPSLVPAYRVELLAGHSESTQLLPGDGSGRDVHNPFLARVAVARELHGKQSERSCLHVELDIADSLVRGPLVPSSLAIFQRDESVSFLLPPCWIQRCVESHVLDYVCCVDVITYACTYTLGLQGPYHWSCYAA